MIKKSKGKKVGEKVPFGRLGGTCPKCNKKEAVVASGNKPHVSFGDGMAGMTHISIDVEPPLLCKFCGTPFRAKRESTFIVVFARVFGRK